jgi:endonuclease/exonuclease/phosphatase (EEP) superfamily protein YafD
MVEAATTRHAEAPGRGSAAPRGPWWVRAARVVAVAYVAGLLAVIVAFRYLGERWWVTSVGLYLPRAGFALPLPFVTLALLVTRSYRWLATQVVALALVLFPLMGLHLPGGRSASAGAHRLRIFTFNINEGRAGIADVVARARAGDPDLIVFQEAGHVESEPLRAGLPGYFFDHTDQFVLASRFPIEERFFPPMLPATDGGRARTRRFVRYRIAVPGGPILLYNIHPVSPREGIDELRGAGLGHELATGRIFRPDTGDLNSSTALRVAQIASVAEDAAGSAYPVLIAGDTNLPELSWAFGRSLARYHDAFAEVGSGFGYTFPATKRRAWLRIDRILGDDRFRFLSSAVVPDRLSDHFALTADVELLPSAR